MKKTKELEKNEMTEKMMKTKKAFTLAETLIALIVLGIIAAMTIPSIINKVQNYANATKLKKVYAALDNAISNTEVLLSIPENYFSNKEEWQKSFVSNIAKNLNTVKICDNFLYNGNICSLYPNKVVQNTPAYKYFNGNNYTNYYGPWGYKFIIKNNIQITLAPTAHETSYNWNFSTTYGVPVDAVFLIDLNGIENKPNKFGRDVFWFGYRKTSTSKQKGFFPIGFYMEDDCVKGGLGITCAKKIVVDKKTDY